MHVVGEWILVFALAASVLGPIQAQPTNPGAAPYTGAIPALQSPSSSLQLTGPTACPPDGCAPGQRIGMRYDYDLNTLTLDEAPGANVRVCLYATSFESAYPLLAATGEISGVNYVAATTIICPAPPTGYNLLAELEGILPVGTPGDALRFAFRLGSSTTGSGLVRAQLFIRSGGSWSASPVTSTFSPLLNINTTSTTERAYVANDAAACGSYSPCYINSYGDEPGGFSTGLKDAIDAGRTDIAVVGNYTINANTVLVDPDGAIAITGVGNAKITYTGSNSKCSNAMLELKEEVDLKGLTINDGSCNSTTATNNRHLIRVSSTVEGTTVRIESNDLTGGNNAIVVSSDNKATVIVRFNHITGNFGQAIYFEADGDTRLQAVANNLHGNVNIPPINCQGHASIRNADHNYWGASAPEGTNCDIDPLKRLGAPIEHKTSAPGVRAINVDVRAGTNPEYAFEDQIGYRRSGTGGSDFPIYIVDHGYMTSSGPPFSGLSGGESPSPCSNYWDVFLADGAAVSSENKLDLFFRYNDKEGDTPGCLSVINSTNYCDQSNAPEDYPLFWLDPKTDGSTNGATNWWDIVGDTPDNLDDEDFDGQTTTCNTSTNEIQVSIDNASDNRPNLNDLGFTPFMVGIPVIKSFKLSTSSQTVTVSWSTNLEPDITGFYVLRGDKPDNLTTKVFGGFISRSGSSTSGYSYSRADTGRANGTTYYYRLQVVRADGYSFYSQIEKISVNVVTPVPPTATYTPTPIRPTNTPQFTTVPNQQPTFMFGKTSTPTKTRTPGPTLMVLPTLTNTPNFLTPGVQETQAILNLTRTAEWGGSGGTGFEETFDPALTEETEIAMVSSATPSPDTTVAAAEAVSVPETGGKTYPWLSLLLGLLAGLAVVGGAGGWWLYSSKK